MVLGVLNQAFDVLVLRYGVQKRIYCNVSAPPPPSPPPTHTHRAASPRALPPPACSAPSAGVSFALLWHPVGRSLGRGLCCPCPHWGSQAVGMAVHCAPHSAVGLAGTRWQRVWRPRPCSPLHPAPGPPSRPCRETELCPPGMGDAGPGSGSGLFSKDPGTRRTGPSLTGTGQQGTQALRDSIMGTREEERPERMVHGHSGNDVP